MKKIEDNCFNEFDPNAVTVDDAIKNMYTSCPLRLNS